MSEDPIRFNSKDQNFYRYIKNLVLTFTDPFGNEMQAAENGGPPSCIETATGTAVSCVASFAGAVGYAQTICLGACGFTGPAAPACVKIVGYATSGPAIGGAIGCLNDAEIVYNQCQQNTGFSE